MKKTICLLLAVVLCFLFVGCDLDVVETNAEVESQSAYYSAKQYNKVLYPEGVTEANTIAEETTVEASAPTTAVISTTELITEKAITTEKAASTTKQVTKIQKPTTTKKASEQKYTVILNTSTHVYHLKNCQAAKKIKTKNRSTMTGTIAQIEAAGYRLCGFCAK